MQAKLLETKILKKIRQKTNQNCFNPIYDIYIQKKMIFEKSA